ncbi:hypothetical protein [Xylella fastidiosa]|nr:hypothetical protein [Xylella fastidiosa]WGZ33590.1 hypothetical protein O4445_07910 [Xylella fastidiosa subsp. pauca]
MRRCRRFFADSTGFGSVALLPTAYTALRKRRFAMDMLAALLI